LNKIKVLKVTDGGDDVGNTVITVSSLDNPMDVLDF